MDKQVCSTVLKNLSILLFFIIYTIKTNGALECSKSAICGPLIILILIIFIYATQKDDNLDYDPKLIKRGQLWRLITSHLTHSSLLHLFFNINGLILLWVLYGKYYTFSIYMALFMISALVCNIGLFLTTDIQNCSGLSAILMGIFIFGIIKDVENNKIFGYLALLFILIKIIYEQLSNKSINSVVGKVAIDAHLYGMLGGILSILCT